MAKQYTEKDCGKTGFFSAENLKKVVCRIIFMRIYLYGLVTKLNAGGAE